MPKEAAKDLIAKLALDDDLRARFDDASSAEDKLNVLSEAGYTIVTPDDLVEVQSDVQQKGMLSDVTGYLSTSIVKAGFDPAGVGAQGAGEIGRTAGRMAESLIRLL